MRLHSFHPRLPAAAIGGLSFRLLAILLLSVPTSGSQASRIGKYVADGAPRPPVFPSSAADCQAYSEALSRFQRDVSARHQSCLDASAKDCPNDAFTGCECQACAQFHGSAPTDGVSACYQAVRDADERIRRVNDAMTSVGTSTTELLVRATVGQAIRNAMGDSQLLKDLGKVSSIAHTVQKIGQSLLALRESVRAGDTVTPSRHMADILQELGRRGLARSPLALLMTDIALEHVGRLQGEALAELDAQLTAISKDLEAQAGSSRIAVPAAECAVLSDERANRELMQRDAAGWLALVTRCNRK